MRSSVLVVVILLLGLSGYFTIRLLNGDQRARCDQQHGDFVCMGNGCRCFAKGTVLR